MLTGAALIGSAYAGKVLYDWHKRVPISGVALVTGGAGGLGLQLCTDLIRAGASAVIVLDLKQDLIDEACERLALLASELRRNVRVKGYACNVADPETVKRVAAKVVAEVGDVDILINNAGVVSGKPIDQLTEKDIRRTFEVNTLAHFWTIQAFLPRMLARDRGVIVTISSAGGIVGTNGLADYSASKFAVYGLDESLRLDLRKRGSKVHTLCVTPFYINTGMFDGVQTKIPLLLPILEPQAVSQAIVEAIAARRHYLEMPCTALTFSWLTKVLPTAVRDKLLDTLGITSSMDDFRGRSKL